MFTFKGDDPNSSTNYTIFQMNFEVGFANKNDDSYNLNFNINEVLKDIQKIVALQHPIFLKIYDYYCEFN